PPSRPRNSAALGFPALSAGLRLSSAPSRANVRAGISPQPLSRQRSAAPLRALPRLLRHQPSHQKNRAADEEQAHFQVHVVLQQSGEQADRKDDHSDQLEEAAKEGGHARSLPAARFV